MCKFLSIKAHRVAIEMIYKTGLLVILAFLSANIVLSETGRDLTTSAEATFSEGTEALKRGDFQAAERAFQKVVSLERRFAPAHLNLGLAFQAQKRYGEAIESFKEALRLDGRLGSAALFLGIAYFEVNQPDKAIEPLQKALILSPKEAPEVHLRLGKVFLAAGKHKEAIQHLEKAVEAKMQDPTLYYSLGRAHMLQAQRAFDELYKKNPQSYLVRFLMGQSYQLEEKYDLAIIEYTKALNLKPDLRAAHEALGDIYWKTQKYDESEVELKRELDIDPYNNIALYKLGRTLAAVGKLDESLSCLRQSVAQNPSLARAHFEIGKVLNRKGQFKEAAKSIQSGLSLDPENGPAYAMLGQSYTKLGETQKAEDAFQMSKTLREKRDRGIHEKISLLDKLYGGDQSEE